jgi:hypothetical protein
MAIFSIENLLEVKVKEKCIFEHSKGKEEIDFDAKDFEKRYYDIKSKWDKEGLKYSIRLETLKVEYYKKE